MKTKVSIRPETIRMIIKDKTNVPLARIQYPKIEVVGEEGMMGDGTPKIAGDGMTVHLRDEGTMTTINREEEEGDLVVILLIEEDQMVHLQEEGGTTTIIVAITIGITVMLEEIDSPVKDPIDPLVERTKGLVIEEEVLEETITVVTDLVAAEVVGDDDRSRLEGNFNLTK